ncbi:carbohydrate ABC transporter permease [Cellulomonas hominis]|jgi:multiple sugar transport system permease protein|uniref:Multiple sugar transport system permease protein n=1 Tax=Cellulomonas hominis TaxID=156981 RepID=A0A511FBW6_9CELL|nr:carbohydrate ABC transporter permease [Cellulomonas hominis]MBB5472688.1 multiple sugar transport system permease protein [Cellulomonas hominis]MBU5421757.1 carbohydrate ABC transporter permease [Cellulomonas hominis]NKY07657.1 carbohydrate ABC transporter permease [Cellulomonas hominis]GEL46751.1 sugar ABC transporter permease [Cellulomonas hominis]
MSAVTLPGVAARPAPRRRRLRPSTVLLTAAVVAATLVALLPLAIVLFTAFKPTAEVNAFPPTLLPDAWTTANFERIFADLPFGRLIANSFLFAGGVTVFALVFDSLAAYALARIDFAGRKALLVAIVATLMIPFQATLIPVYQIVSDLGWVNTFAGLIAPRAADAFGIFFLRQFFISLPRDLDNAARIDGASELRVFTQIVLPNARPALMTLAIFVFVNNWNDLLWPLVFTTQREMGTITSGLTLLTGPGGIVPYGVMMAGALVAVVPLVVAFLFVQRRFIESIATTGLK